MKNKRKFLVISNGEGPLVLEIVKEHETGSLSVATFKLAQLPHKATLSVVEQTDEAVLGCVDLLHNK